MIVSFPLEWRHSTNSKPLGQALATRRKNADHSNHQEPALAPVALCAEAPAGPVLFRYLLHSLSVVAVLVLGRRTNSPSC